MIVLKKILIFVVFCLSIVLTACSNDELIYNGHEVSTIEIGNLEYYVEVTDSEDQKAILTEISELEYSELEGEENGVAMAIQYTLKLTYTTGDSCVIIFDFENNIYSVETTDKEGNVIQDESGVYSASEEELKSIKTWWI